MEIQHIVVGMDGGKLADPAILTALDLSRQFGVGVEVLHAVNMIQPRWWMEDSGRWARVQAQTLAQARQSRLEHLSRILVDAGRQDLVAEEMLHVLPGRPAQVLADHVASHGPALLMLGKHRDQGLFDLGGATRELLSACPCPVWVQGVRQSKIERILVPLDLFPGRRLIVEAAVTLARVMGADLKLLHCYQPPCFAFDPHPELAETAEDFRRSAKEEFEEFVAELEVGELSMTSEFVDGEVAPTILGFEDKTDITVMGTHSHRGLSRLVLGNQTHRVLAKTRAPVLAIPLEASQRLVTA